jgi:RNase H
MPRAKLPMPAHARRRLVEQFSHRFGMRRLPDAQVKFEFASLLLNTRCVGSADVDHAPSGGIAAETGPAEVGAEIISQRGIAQSLQRVTGSIEVRTDSTYIEKCFTEDWHVRWRRDDKWRTPKGPVKNRDLWERLFALVEDDARDVSFVWVKGHATEANNNIVDRLSREASRSHAEN